jgi:Flp pilus assembly protein TadB
MQQNSFEPEGRTALEKALRDAQSTNTFRRFFSDYGITYFVTLCYAFIAWLGASGLILFLGMLVIVLSFHGVSEQRAERRHKLRSTHSMKLGVA